MRTFFTRAELEVVKAPVSRIPACDSCGLFRSCHSPKMPPSGKGRDGVLVVAEAPGKEEDRAGVQLVGSSGQKLEQVLRKHGLDMRRDCTLTNALICRPPNNVIPNDKVITYCRPNLINTVERLKPRLIILLGGSAVESLLGWLWRDKQLGGIAQWAGYQIPDQKLNAWICPTYHPAYLLHEKSNVLEILFDRHLAAAAKLRDRPWAKLPRYEDRVEVIKDAYKASKRIRRFKKGLVTFDYETNMLKPDSPLAQIVSCAISDGDTTIAYPWYGPAIDATREMLMNPRVRKAGANIKFEERWTVKEFGTGVVGWDIDIMLRSHHRENASKTRKITSVKFQAYVKLGQHRWDEHIEPYLKSRVPGCGNSPNRIKELNLGQLLKYNGMDALSEYLIARKMKGEG